MRDRERSGDVGIGFAGRLPVYSLPSLIRRKCRLSSHLHAAGLRPCPTFGRSNLDQIALDIGTATKYRQHKPAGAVAGVSLGLCY